jgi:DNA polymerase-3 subunit epsilon
VKLDGAHSADADAVAACRVAWRLGQQYPRLAELDLAQLHKAQVEWAAEQASSFQAHLRSKGKTDVIDGSWPLRPVEDGGAS